MAVKTFEAKIFADNFVNFMSEMFDVEWDYQEPMSPYMQSFFDDEFTEMIEFYERQDREDLNVYMGSNPRLWGEDFDDFSNYYYVFADRIVRYFTRKPYNTERFVQLCVLLCTIAKAIASNFSVDTVQKAMIHAYAYIAFLASNILRNGTFSNSTW